MTNGGKVSALAWSLMVHAVIAAGFVVTLQYTLPVRPSQPAGEVIQAVAIDAEALRERERAKAEALRRAEAARRREREAAERAAAEQRRREEAARQAELRRQEAAREKAEAEARRVAAEARAKAERERQAEEARRKAEAERQRREAEAAARAAREEQMLRSLEAEEQRLAAIRSGKQAEWISAIRGRIERILVIPPGTKEDYFCEASVRQIPGGEVVTVTIGKCDGDLLARAVETAIWKASPLPPPSDPSLFDQYVNIVFAPED